jgi:hypothetical protein
MDGRYPEAVSDLSLINLLVVAILGKGDAEYKRAVIRDSVSFVVFADQPDHLDSLAAGYGVTVDAPVALIRTPDESTGIATGLPSQFYGERQERILMLFEEFALLHGLLGLLMP